jgi:hypothetical protein
VNRDFCAEEQLDDIGLNYQVFFLSTATSFEMLIAWSASFLADMTCVLRPMNHGLVKSDDRETRSSREVWLWEVCRPELVTPVTRRSRKPLDFITMSAPST